MLWKEYFENMLRYYQYVEKSFLPRISVDVLPIFWKHKKQHILLSLQKYLTGIRNTNILITWTSGTDF